MRARLLPSAAADVVVAAAYMNARYPGRGDRFAATVQRFVTDLERFPQGHGRVARPPRGREVRHGVVRRYLYIVTYEVRANEVVVLSVGHGRRQSQDWRRRLRDA